LDGKGTFAAGLLCIRKRLEERFYPSVASFSADLASLFTSEIGVESAGDTAELQEQIAGRASGLSIEQREKRKLAKRIIKAIQPALEDAIRKESELNRKPFEKELKELDVILDHSVMSRRDSLDMEGDTEMETAQPDAMEDVKQTGDAPEVPAEPQHEDGTAPDQETAPEGNGEEPSSEEGIKPNINTTYNRHPTPELSEEEQQLPLARGGIQWYMQPFDPVGTTIHEERWTGRDVMRGMSEELSELDEDELQDLVDDETDAKPAETADAGKSKQNVRRTRRGRK
jgi:NuA3 HAT complex component NTO1